MLYTQEQVARMADEEARLAIIAVLADKVKRGIKGRELHPWMTALASINCRLLASKESK